MLATNKRKIVAVVMGFASIGVMAILHYRLDGMVKEQVDTSGKVHLPSAESARLFSLGYDRFLADMYWLAFIQYCGDTRPRGIQYQSTYDYLNLITELDPYFDKAYWFGCWAIGYWQRRPDLANKLIQRGITYNPTDWYMPYMAGVNQYLFAKDYKAAAKYYRQAAKLPDAPAYLDKQATILESPIPEIAKQLQTLTHLYKTAPEGNLKSQAHTQLAGLLYRMYKEAPTETIRKFTRERMVNVGINPDDLINSRELR